MRVLIGAEFSGVVRRAFRARGHDAMSCDLLPATDGSPDHYQGDVREVLDHGWDLGIFHLPCTYFCNSSVWAFTRLPPNPSPGVKYGAERWAALDEAIALWLTVWQSAIPKIAMENPVAHGFATKEIGKPTQTIQPYQFGEDASKRTCLWLKNLQSLTPTGLIAPRRVNGKPRWGNQTDGGQNKLTPSVDRWALRSITYEGIAAAMAAQWG